MRTSHRIVSHHGIVISILNSRTNNPERNSFAFITSLEEDGGRVAVFFDKNVQFDGDQVNKATSIHRRTNIVGLMNNLSDNSIIYVKNKNEFDTLVGMADSIPAAYKGKTKFVEDSISQDDGSVKRSDRKAETKNLAVRFLWYFEQRRLIKQLAKKHG